MKKIKIDNLPRDEIFFTSEQVELLYKAKKRDALKDDAVFRGKLLDVLEKISGSLERLHRGGKMEVIK